MKSHVLGLFLSIAIIFYAFTNTGEDNYAYYDFMSLLIVFGGSFGVSIMTMGIKESFKLSLLFFKLFENQKHTNVKIIKEVVELARRQHSGTLSLGSLSDKDYHPFLVEGLRFIHNKFDDQKIRKLMVNMAYQRQVAHEGTVEQIETLAKYPPAFGMMGTIIGLIAVMKQINTAEGVSSIGPSMALALVTTLYGILLSNYVLLPIADNLYSRSQREAFSRQLISEGVILMSQGHDPVYIREALLSYLQPDEKLEFLAAQGLTMASEDMAA